MTSTSSLLLLIVIGCFALAHSLPTLREVGEEAPLSPRQEELRKRWNGARRAYKEIQKRVSAAPRRRRANTDQEDFGALEDIDPEFLASITGQQYIADLYSDLVDSSTPDIDTQANTIRSLPYISGSGKLTS